MQTFSWDSVTELCTVAGWVRVEKGSLTVDALRIDLNPTRVVLFRDDQGQQHVVPVAAVHGWRIDGELETWVNPYATVHSHSGVDFAAPAGGALYPSNVSHQLS